MTSVHSLLGKFDIIMESVDTENLDESIKQFLGDDVVKYHNLISPWKEPEYKKSIEKFAIEIIQILENQKLLKNAQELFDALCRTDHYKNSGRKELKQWMKNKSLAGFAIWMRHKEIATKRQELETLLNEYIKK